MSPGKFSNIKSKVGRNTKIVSKVEQQKKVDFFNKITYGGYATRSNQLLQSILETSKSSSAAKRPQTTGKKRIVTTKSVAELRTLPQFITQSRNTEIFDS